LKGILAMALDILAIAAKLNGLTLPHATGKIAQAREQASVRNQSTEGG
jgi:hypothetical protein